MNHLNFFLVTYDRLLERVIEDLEENELNYITTYAVQKSVPKNLCNKIKVLNEWELPWNDYTYQNKQYYEYGTMVHILMNPSLTKNLSHIGLLHYDVKFKKNSVNQIIESLKNEPNTILFQRVRGVEDLYLTFFEVQKICEFLSEKLEMKFHPEIIWEKGWISEALSVTPKDIFLKFAQFLKDYGSEIENILISNRWGIMNVIDHRVCGIVERMWGFYLVSLIVNGYKFEKMNVEHDWDFYTHKHQSQENWIKIKN
jgi:hypothetical protein